MQGWGHLVPSFYIPAVLSPLGYLFLLPSPESLCLPRKYQVEKTLLQGGEGRAKIVSPWTTSLGVISHFSLSHILKSARSVFPQSLIIWNQISFLKTFYLRYEKVAWDPACKGQSYYLRGESSWSIIDVQQYDKTGTVLSSLGKGLSFSRMLI